MSHNAPNHGMRIAGQTVGADRTGERCIEVMNPFTGQCIASVPKATLADVRQAFAIGHAYKARLVGNRRCGIKDSGLGYKEDEEGVQEAMKSFTNVKTYSLPWA